MAIKRITTNLIEDGSIGTIDIANNAITAAKITDGNITTAKLADLNVTAGKLAGTLDLTGKTVTVATATTGDSDTSPASTAFVQQEIAALVDSSPSALNTLNELANALGDNENFATDVTASIATKAPLDSPVFSSTYTSGQDETLAEFRRDGGAVAAKIIYADATTDMEFGTTTSHALSLTTADTRRLTIDSSGNVGIGATPQSTVGIVDIAGAATNYNTAPMITFRDTAGSTNSRNWSIGNIAINYGDFHIGCGDTNSDYFDATSHSKFMINKDGNVGIADTTPDQKLVVKNGNIKLKSNSDGNTGIVMFYDATGASSGQIYPVGGDLRIWSPNDVLMMPTGNIGIGTTSPSTRLQVNASSAIADELILKLDGGETGFSSANDANIKHGLSYELCSYSVSTGIVQRQAAKIEVQKVGSWNEATAGNVGTKADLVFSTNNGTIATPAIAERMRIDSSGNVGIGATSANSSRLRLDNGGTSGAPQLMLTATGASTQTEIRHDTSNNLIFENWNSGRTERMRIDSSGTMILQADGAANLGRIQFSNQASTYQILGGNYIGYMGYKTGGYHRWFGSDTAEKMRIDNSGNVGIGVTNPDSYDSRAEKLVVGETGDAGITIAGGASSDCRLVFAVTNQTDLSNGSITYDQSIDSMAFETAGSERMRIDQSGDMIYGGSTGVSEKYFSGSTTGQGTFSHDITHTSDGGTGTILHIEAAFTHHPAYDCILDTWISRRGTGLSHYETRRRDTSTSGSWTVSGVSNTVTRVTKNAGSYIGGGPYWIKVTWKNHS
jgi:hypothetical protein